MQIILVMDTLIQYTDSVYGNGRHLLLKLYSTHTPAQLHLYIQHCTYIQYSFVFISRILWALDSHGSIFQSNSRVS